VHLATWIVTYVTPTNPREAVFFAYATSAERARDLVSLKTGIDGGSLSVVRLTEELSPVPSEARGRPGLERYLGPLEQYSPYLRASCAFCRGTGRVLGSKPAEPCPTCGGSGLKTTR